jgi:putative ABC transport system substrate-binding protein
MKRRTFIAALGGAAAWPVVADAQQSGAMPVVGYIDMRGTPYEPFVQGLSDVGFVDHSNVFIDHRAVSEVDQLPAIAVEMARNNVAVIVAASNAIVAAKAVTSTIPLVFLDSSDPVAVGLVASFNHPGGNVTGVRFLAGDLPAKQIEFLHELIPTATKVGLLISPRFTDAEPRAAVASEAARTIGLTPIVERVITETEFETAFTRFAEQGVSAILLLTNVFFASVRDRLLELALHHGIAMFGQARSYAIAGALASYGPNYPDVMRQSGVYAGRILKGEKPADMPVLQPTTFDLVINLKTAKALGLTVPPSILARADEVIE